MTAKPSTDPCDEKHQGFFDEYVAPRLTLKVGAMLGAVLVTGLLVVMWVNAAQITKHELQDSGTYVTKSDHSKDVARLEAQIEKLDQTMNNSTAAIIQAIRESKR